MTTGAPWPETLAFRAGARALDIRFDDGQTLSIPFELLRVESPSAEVQGHAAHQKKLVAGKARVQVTGAEPVGRYAVRLTFDDGHDSGIYSWRYLRELGETASERLDDYARRLKAAGLSR
ncbi:DUF971 domain-containing protein [Hyphomonadaceae bacterium BL14]|nr:DUF971 domain-containing protein [Hyphomonadaceae bacterium BL14]